MMIKADFLSITKQLDAGVLADVELHNKLWKEWDTLAEVNEDDPRIGALSDRTSELAKRIVVTPVHTAEALGEKRRIIELEAFESWDDLGLIEVILKLDAERVGAEEDRADKATA